MLEEVEILIGNFIKEVDLNIFNLYSSIPKGKMLRAKLIFKIAGYSKESIRLASVVEMIHTASLLHDDVIDRSLKRRGESSINALYGDKVAIMLGDILYSKGFFELLTLNKEIAEIISDAVVKLSIGEMLDVDLSKEINYSRELYFDMIYKKTASLIEATAKSAAILSKKDGDSFGLYGKNLGLAFQIVDDILDITMSDKELGKPALADFKDGKTTLPYIYLLERLSPDDRDRLISLYKRDLTAEDSSWIKRNMIESGAIEQSKELVQKLAQEALEAIKDYKSVDLERIIIDMIKRDY